MLQQAAGGQKASCSRISAGTNHHESFQAAGKWLLYDSISKSFKTQSSPYEQPATSSLTANLANPHAKTTFAICITLPGGPGCQGLGSKRLPFGLQTGGRSYPEGLFPTWAPLNNSLHKQGMQHGSSGQAIIMPTCQNVTPNLLPLSMGRGTHSTNSANQTEQQHCSNAHNCHASRHSGVLCPCMATNSCNQLPLSACISPSPS